jgi:hypothetical protein
MLKGNTMALISVLWFLLGSFSLLRTEFLPERFQAYTAIRVLGYLSWHAWLFVLLGLLLGVLLEGGCRNSKSEQKVG